MISSKDGTWVKTKDGVFINLNYVNAVRHVENAYVKSAVLLIMGDNTSHEVSDAIPEGDSKSEADVLTDIIRKGKENIMPIGSCSWITCYNDVLVNINHVDELLLTPEHSVHYDSESDDYDAHYDLTLKNSNLKTGLFGLDILGEEAFRQYFNLPANDLRAGFAGLLLKRFGMSGNAEHEWKRTVRQLTGDEILIIDVSADEAMLLNASFDSVISARQLQEMLIVIINDGASRESVFTKMQAAILKNNPDCVLITEIEFLAGLEQTQKLIADVLVMVATGHKTAVCIYGNNVKKPAILIQCIQEYNYSIRVEENNER